METRRKKQTQKNFFTMASGGLVIVVRNFIDRKQNFRMLFTVIFSSSSSSPCKSVNIYRLARMARNFNDYPGFQPKTMYYFAHDCMIGRCAYSFPCPSFKERCSSQQKGTTKSRCGLKVSPLSSYCLGAATDYGHTKAKSLIICGPNSNPNPKKLFGMWI